MTLSITAPPPTLCAFCHDPIAAHTIRDDDPTRATCTRTHTVTGTFRATTDAKRVTRLVPCHCTITVSQQAPHRGGNSE